MSEESVFPGESKVKMKLLYDQYFATAMAQLKAAEKYAEDPAYAEASLQLTQAALALMYVQ